MAIKPFSELDTAKQLLSTGSIKNTLTNIVLSRDEVDPDDISEALRVINRRFSFPMKHRTLELYGNKKVILLSNKETLKLPQTIPAWTVSDNTRGFITYVNFTPYMPNRIENVDTRKLYGMLQFGTVMNETVKYFDKLAYNNKILQIGSKLYASMIVKVFNRIAGVSIDPMHKNQLMYFFAKFYMINLLGRTPNETIENIAHNLTMETGMVAKESFEAAVASKLKAQSQTDLYRNGLLDIIKALTESKEWLNKVNNRNFVQNYLSLYNAISFLGMERLDYFLAIVATYYTDTGLVNDYVLANVFGRDAGIVYDEFVRLTR